MSKDTPVGTGSVWQCTVKRHHKYRIPKRPCKNESFRLGLRENQKRFPDLGGVRGYVLYPLGIVHVWVKWRNLSFYFSLYLEDP
jgi:hypothetical protein